MKFRLVWMRSKQPTEGGLGQVILSGGQIQIREITLCPFVPRRHLDSRLQLADGGVRLALRSQHPPQLDVDGGRVRVCHSQLAQIIFRLRKTPSPHVNVSQTDDSVRGSLVERKRLLVFLLGVGELVFLLQKLPGRKMGLGFFGLESRRALVIGKCFFRLRFFDRVGKRKPGPVLALGGMSGRFQLGSSPQKFLRVRLAGLRELQPQIQTRFENIRLRRNRFAISRNGCVQVAQCIFHESQIKPPLVARGITLNQLAKQRLGGRVIFFLNRRFCRRKFGRLRRSILHRNLNVMNLPVTRL